MQTEEETGSREQPEPEIEPAAQDVMRNGTTETPLQQEEQEEASPPSPPPPAQEDSTVDSVSQGDSN